MLTRRQANLKRDTMWNQLPNDIKGGILSHYDVRTLTVKKRVCRSWRTLCTQAIDAKCTQDGTSRFISREQLVDAVKRYCGCIRIQWADGRNDLVIMNGIEVPTPEEAERIAQMHGWPINRWDVSAITDFSEVFFGRASFNESISSWDMSSALTMEFMFCEADSFNQDLSTWNVSSVRNMRDMFRSASSFNGNIRNWDVSNVTDMTRMFAGASSFNQDLRHWNITGRAVGMIDIFADTRLTREVIDGWDNWNWSDMENEEDSDESIVEMPDMYDSE